MPGIGITFQAYLPCEASFQLPFRITTIPNSCDVFINYASMSVNDSDNFEIIQVSAFIIFGLSFGKERKYSKQEYLYLLSRGLIP